MPTKIEWCDETYNPVTGCLPELPCWQRCYARRMANRLAGRFGYDADEPFRPTLHADKLLQPVKWRKPRRVFVSSMGDLFCDGVPDEWIERVMHTIRAARQHTYMILTKRPQRMAEWFHEYYEGTGWKGLWLGISASTSNEFGRRWEYLSHIRAEIRFVSFEPLLEGVRFWGGVRPDWVIVGPETGPCAREMDLQWARDILDECRDRQVPFFYKPGPLDGVVWNEFPR